MAKNALISHKSTALATAGEIINYRDSWRIFKIMSEFVEGYQFLDEFKREVTILGSARLPSNNKYYKITEQLGYLLAKNGFTVITGGGPGIMEAANKGAFEAGGESVGLNIQLPFEQRINPYVKKSVAFYYFFTRKVMLTSPANAFVFLPGGFGTLDEFFEVVDMMEIGQMPQSPIVLVGKEFWQPLIDFVRNYSAREANALSEKIVDSWHVVETAEEAFELIKNASDRPSELATISAEHHKGGADWRIFRIMSELVDGFEFLTKLDNDVTVLGTKSTPVGSPYYKAAYELGKMLAKNKMGVVTGGGPGIMEAANKGSFENKGASVGMNMRFENHERTNDYLNRSIGFSFPFVRKLIITAPSEAFVFFPGGLGTLHQLFELLTLQETKKMIQIPTILYGKKFWRPMIDYIRKLHHDFQTISQSDEDLVKVVDSPEEVLFHINKQ
ncbi:MAG: hypothetical protein COU29_03085 [Candidatus Magasanikbacteria bacterium CG10_big_fil_rev_8_21_14_0_10_36_32]|uniref:Cytokinin riboside 5'-monophosphate phosphoribohydrolase n=1 Tax=Candidatus Magasanikbacteria bacterium CG10_big_fil_rev_8_21_14_0_10_36_32 TaxID=1974646 RepID=A0A2M6W624_9BACT|nr:MAG: hypothetical protein COU29_03085 [Candidatus Magasanikbacteria bacterium CG10_big_fil_rev_8_21_14_0_10_36_32]